MTKGKMLCKFSVFKRTKQLKHKNTMKIVTCPQFEPEIILSVSSSDTVLFSSNREEQGEWDVNDISFFQEELPDKYYPDNAENDPAFQLVMMYVHECIHETGVQINDGLITEDEYEELDDLYYNGDAKALFEWRFGSLENGLQYVESIRSLLRSFASKEHINYMDRKKIESECFIEQNSEIDTISSTYRIIMGGNEDHFVGENDWAKLEEETSYITKIPFKTM